MAVLRIETREQIVECLKAGYSQNEIARRLKINPSTVSRFAAKEGLSRTSDAPKKALEAAAAYNAIYTLKRRLALSDKFFALVEGALDGDLYDDLKDLALTFAILVDKRRLEEGEATERHEYSDSDREFVERRLDELAARRRAKSVAEGADAGPGEAAAV